MIRLGRITIPAGTSRNNATTGASVLDLGTLGGGNLDTWVRAHAGGVAGDLITVAAAGDSALGAGAYLTTVANAVTIHFESGVSTVADVEAAIAAVADASKKIDVDIIGTPGTVLSAPGDEFAATNLAGGATGAFEIPNTTRTIYVQPDSASVFYASTPSSDDPVVLTADASDYALTSGTPFREVLGSTAGSGAPWAVAAYNGGGGTAILSVISAYG